MSSMKVIFYRKDTPRVTLTVEDKVFIFRASWPPKEFKVIEFDVVKVKDGEEEKVDHERVAKVKGKRDDESKEARDEKVAKGKVN